MTALPDEGESAETLRVVPSSPLICVRYPNGYVEYSSAAETPVVGDVVARGGEKWPVVQLDVDGYGNPVVNLGRLDGEADDDGSASTRNSDEASE
jgi:hypothetical protein